MRQLIVIGLLLLSLPAQAQAKYITAHGGEYLDTTTRNPACAKAFPLIDQAVALDANRYLAYRGFLRCIFATDYARALADFRRVNLLKPNGWEMDHTYPFYADLCNLELGNYKQATADFANDMRLQSGADGRGDIHFNTLLYAGLVALRRQQYPQAQTYPESCLQVYSQHPEAN